MEATYCKYIFHTVEEERDLLLAHLHQLGFDSFEETSKGWDAYITEKKIATEKIEEALFSLSTKLTFSYSTEIVPKQNWNALWEANFEIIRVNDFCSVRADFHTPVSGVRYEIVINPKMAFGTGHHATTYMMLAAMKDLPILNAKVLDYGCGTGILAILAAKMGASIQNAVDIELDAYENTLENCKTNAVSSVCAFHGTLQQIEDKNYDIILANINRNVILNSFSALYDKLVGNGLLLISGILVEDRGLIISEASAAGFSQKQTWRRNGWLAILFCKA